MVCRFNSPNMEPDCVSVLSKMFTCGKVYYELKKRL